MRTPVRPTPFKMDIKVPGGRTRSGNEGELSCEDAEGSLEDSLPQNPTQTRSLPRLSSTVDESEIVTPQSGAHTLNSPVSLHNKKKTRSGSFRAFGNMVHKFVQQVSHASFHNSPRLSQKFDKLMTGKLKSDHNETMKLNGGSMSFNGVNNAPGVVGIRNHGNTCFMNSVLQCLSNTDLLVEYFVFDQYKQDIKRNSKLHSKKYGTKGELTENLAILLKSLWTSKYIPEISTEFKSVVGKYGSQYRGYTQHDAQEFLMWLLDKVHEDLNIATKKKYKTIKGSQGRSDEAAAQEALANHNRCNKSFVYSLFQALYRSSLTCPHCRKQSNTFDPFLSVSLPIPQKLQRPVYVTVVYLDAKPKQVRIGLILGQGDSVRDLRQIVANDTKIPEELLILTEMYYEGFHRTFHDSQTIGDLHEADNIYAIETLSVSSPNTSPSSNGSVTSNDSPSTEKVTLVTINKQGSGNQCQRFGGVYVSQISRDCSFLSLQNHLLQQMAPIMRDCVIAQKPGVVLRLRVVDGIRDQCYLPADVDLPLYMPTVDRALSLCVPGGGPQHLKLIVEWDQKTKQCLIGNDEEVIEDHESVRRVCLHHQQPALATLDECFQLYTQEERLSGDDAWLCPNCRRRQQGTIKSISLWFLPDTLVIHLKRFKQDNMRRTKLNTLITFPVTGLDMSHHVAKQQRHGNHHIYSRSHSGWSPWRPQKKQGDNSQYFIYDLYAVCNHYGNMQGGHYTAFCKNPSNGKWYSYDDTKVTPMQEEEVVTRAAYLLFYERRSSANHQYGEPAHWSHRLGNVLSKDVKTKTKPISKSHEDLLDGKASDEECLPSTTTSPANFSRTVDVYATMRSAPRSRPVSHNDNQTVNKPPPSPAQVLPNSTLSPNLRHGSSTSSNASPSSIHGGFSPSPSKGMSPSSPAGSDHSSSPSVQQKHAASVKPVQRSATSNSINYHSSVSSSTDLSSNTSSPCHVNGYSAYHPPTLQATPPIRKVAIPTGVIRQRSKDTVLESHSPKMDSLHTDYSTPVHSSKSATGLASHSSPNTRSKPFAAKSSTKTQTSANGSLVRSLTSPEVTSQINSDTITRKKGETSDRELQQWEYKRTVFLQESSV